MKIAIDMDDVLVDFVGGILAAVKKEYGVDIHIERTGDNGWDLNPLLNPIIGRPWWEWLKEREWLWSNFDAVDGAIGSIDQLRRDGHYLELITSKPDWAEHNVWKWLGKWRPAFNRVTVIGLHDNKADFSDADLLIDDKPANCDSFIIDGRKAILYRRPHNNGFHTGYAYVAKDWNEVLQLVKEIDSGG